MSLVLDTPNLVQTEPIKEIHMYFFYQQNFSGQYKPRKEIHKPTGKSAEGNQKSKMSQVVELPSYQREYSIEELTTIYPLKETADG